MSQEAKDIRFAEKKVDDSWKDQATRDRDSSQSFAKNEQKNSSGTPPQKTLKPFVNLLTSLGLQAMMHLGEIPNPEINQQEVNLEAAKEIIDLISAVKVKTEGNRSPEENNLIESLLPELQMKFSKHV